MAWHGRLKGKRDYPLALTLTPRRAGALVGGGGAGEEDGEVEALRPITDNNNLPVQCEALRAGLPAPERNSAKAI